jgi:hypothetical protein
VARGQIVYEQALSEALQRDHFRDAALDADGAALVRPEGADDASRARRCLGRQNGQQARNFGLKLEA